MSYFGRSPQLVPVTTLPSASANSGRVMMQGSKMWFSDGASWLDLTGGNTTYAAQNTASAKGSGPTLTLTEAQVGSTVTLSNVAPTSTILIIARVNPVKDATTTVRTATFRVRRGTLNTDTQIGGDCNLTSTAVASTPFGSGVVVYTDTGHGGGTLNYSLRGITNVVSTVTTPFYELVAIELKGIKGDAGPTGPAADIHSLPTVFSTFDQDEFMVASYDAPDETPAAPQWSLRKMTLGALKTFFGLNAGLYTPTITAVANCTISGTQYGQFIRVGNIVFFSIQATLTPTAAATLTSFTFSLPVASTFALTIDSIGTLNTNVANTGANVVRADGSLNKGFASYTPSVTGAQGVRITGSYIVS